MSAETPGAQARTDITQLLNAWRSGDPAAAHELFPIIYQELRVLARRQLAKGSGDNLQTTDVVHEAYLRFAESSGLRFADRGHFFAVASKAMRQILVDLARRQAAAKRGGDRVRVDLDDNIPIEEHATEIVAIDQALDRLERLEPRLVRIVELRFFSGLSIEETAEAIESSTSTVKRDWTKARAFLYRELATSPGASL